MRKDVDFFGTPRRRPRMQCHVDGISIPGVGSLRLSNIPKNLGLMANLLLTLVKKTRPILFYSFALSILNTRADDDCKAIPIMGEVSDVYLNYSQKNAFLWIQYNPDSYLWRDINNTCNFSLAAKQPGNYELVGCACALIDDAGNLLSWDTKLYGQNLPLAAVNCVEDFLKENCLLSKPVVIMLATVILLGGGVVLIGAVGIAVCKRLNARRPEHPLLLNPEDQREEEKSAISYLSASSEEEAKAGDKCSSIWTAITTCCGLVNYLLRNKGSAVIEDQENYEDKYEIRPQSDNIQDNRPISQTQRQVDQTLKTRNADNSLSLSSSTIFNESDAHHKDINKNRNYCPCFGS